MGKGDRKSKRGKIHRGTYGKHRLRKIKQIVEAEVKEEKSEKKK